MGIEDIDISVDSVAKGLKQEHEVVSSFEPNFNKKDFEWKNELVTLGLIENNRMFTIPGQSAPIAITLATPDFQGRCGSNPRITLFKKSLSDAVLCSILEKYELEVTKSFGSTLKGYDFPDVKESATLAKVLAVIVSEYEQRKAENARPNFISKQDEDIFGEFI